MSRNHLHLNKVAVRMLFLYDTKKDITNRKMEPNSTITPPFTYVKATPSASALGYISVFDEILAIERYALRNLRVFTLIA